MKLDRRSPVLEALAELYAKSAAGETGAGKGYIIRYEKLLAKAACTTGERHENAQADLRKYDGTALRLRYFRDRPSNGVTHVLVPPECETALFELLKRESPTAEREAWVSLFEDAAGWIVPETRQRSWQEFCHARATQAQVGTGWKPFRRSQPKRAKICLEITAKLLAWSRPCLLRTASAQLAGSKFLETSASMLQTLLAEASGGAVQTFRDLHIEYNPTKVCFHGPVRVRLDGVEKNYADFAGESAIAEEDLSRAESIHFDAPRCVTVENATKFHELRRLRSGDVFVFTSYPNKATVDFLKCLPAEVPLYHFGDTDPWGFDVLRTLRKALDRPVHPLHMRYRPKENSPALTERDRRKLERLLTEPQVSDVRGELQRLSEANAKGDFEQETLLLTQNAFPYVS